MTTCSSYRFYHAENKECRRYAPRMISGSGTGWSDQHRPQTASDDWCGEAEYLSYEKKEEER